MTLWPWVQRFDYSETSYVQSFLKLDNNNNSNSNNNNNNGHQRSEREKSMLRCIIHGGGGFFLACEDFEKMFDHLFPACASFFF